MSKKLIIFTDIGDTIIDEGSEVRNVPGGVVLRAGCIPGAKEVMLRLYEEGYTFAMVADGLMETFHNTKFLLQYKRVIVGDLYSIKMET